MTIHSATGAGERIIVTQTSVEGFQAVGWPLLVIASQHGDLAFENLALDQFLICRALTLVPVRAA